MVWKGLLLLVCSVTVVQLQAAANIEPIIVDGESCITRKEVENLIENQTNTLTNLLRSEIQMLRADLVPEEIVDKTPEIDYNATGTQVANLDMTNTSHKCPSGFRQLSSPRSCGGGGRGCTSTTFPVNGSQYSRVCGRVKAYQYASADGFAAYYDSRYWDPLTIDDAYVDGVSITHGQSPRQHIWTFSTGLIQGYTTSNACPCSTDRPFRGSIPPFVGQDYFCESASHSGWEYRLYRENPLWDGQGCARGSTCCSFNKPPWFCKQLSQPTTDDIELRVCLNSPTSDEDIQLEIVELYIQ